MVQHSTFQLAKIHFDVVESEQIALLEKHRNARACLEFGWRDPEKQGDDRDPTSPRGTEFCPNIWSIQSPRSQQHNKLVGAFQKSKDIFLEIGSRVDLGLIEKGLRASQLDLASDLFGYPSV